MANATKGQAKMQKIMHEFKMGELNSGSPKGPKVRSRKQAIAIGLSAAGMSRQTKTRKTRSS